MAAARSEAFPGPASSGMWRAGGFTLLELLVVITILGILAALSVPALKNLGKSNVAVSASRQLLDDVGHARQLAISHRASVLYMVFVPTNFFNAIDPYDNQNFWADLNNMTSATNRTVALQTATNLLERQLTGYTYISYGQVGDQPGQHSYHYLDTWQALPDGTFIAAQKFALPGGAPNAGFQIPQWQSDYLNQLDNQWRYPPTYPPLVYCFTNILVPFPTEQSPSFYLPCIAFNSQGQLVSESPDGISLHHAYIPLAQGTVSYGYDGTTKTPRPSTVQISDITETPPGNSTGISYNIIDIDPLTGRASQQFYKIQ